MLFARWRPSALPVRARRAALALALLGLLLAIWACGFSLGSHIGAHPLPVTQLPDAKLRLAIRITGQYSSAANVFIQVRVFEGTNMSDVALADTIHVTCNGAAAYRDSVGSLSIQCPRQPPGGTYQLAFTDTHAHNATTTVIVPVPFGTFAIVSPRDGETVPIPANGALAVRYALPIPPAHGRVAVDNVTASCNLTETTPCGAVYANLQPYPTPTPGANPTPTTELLATPYQIVPTPTPGANSGGTPIPRHTPLPTIPPAAPTASVTQSGQAGVVQLAGDYSSFVPAPGIISMSVEVNDAPDPGGFAGVVVNFSDILHANITWIH